MLYPIMGWGAMLFVHWWFFVRNAERLCMIKEERTLEKMGSATFNPE
jgi:hypothetical protein